MALLHPESDLRQSLPALGADILHYLHKHDDKVIVDNLLKDFLKRDKNRTIVQFFSALEFLYTIGMIQHEQYRILLVKMEDNPRQQSLFPEEDK